VTQPFVSIIIPVASAHRRHLRTSLASVRWQTVPDWQAVICNDTGAPINVQGDDRIIVADVPQGHTKRRASVARNAGIERATGMFTIFLDADDYLLPGAIETFVRGHVRHDKAYSYAEHYGLQPSGEWAQYRPPDYNREPRASALSHSTKGPGPVPTMQGCNLHPITAFVPTACIKDVGGFDEDAPGFEDWTIWLRLAMAGHCGERIYGPVFVYRRLEGLSSEKDARGGQALMDRVTAPYRDRTGDIPMAGCGCGGGAKAAKDMARQLVQTFGSNLMADEGLVTLEYIGRGDGKQMFRTPAGREVRAGRHAANRYVRVDADDVPYLVNQLNLFQRVPPAAPFVPPPETDVAVDTIAESAAPPKRGRPAKELVEA